ncbi:MAG: glycosyltransferase family 4 protein, partial [Firmicutes bacterium]|nr:glycosyltransferase family 4 protein [Bacillota bacterium]
MVRDGVDGFLTAPDAGEFRDRVVRLLDDCDLRRAMGARGREAVEELSITNCTRRLVEWYGMLVRRRGRHAL